MAPFYFHPKWDREPTAPHILSQMIDANLRRLAWDVQWEKPSSCVMMIHGHYEQPHESTDKAVEALLRRMCDVGAACDFVDMEFTHCPLSDGTLLQALRYSALKPSLRTLSMWDHDIQFARAEVLGRALAASNLQHLQLHVESAIIKHLSRATHTGGHTQASEACDRFLAAFLDRLTTTNRVHHLTSLRVATNSTDLVVRIIASPHLPALRTLQIFDYTGDRAPIAAAMKGNTSLIDVQLKDVEGRVVPGSPEALIERKTTANYRREKCLFRAIVRTIVQARVLARIARYPPTTAVRPRVGLADMPNEIKANILRYCAPQGTLPPTHAQRLLEFAAKPKGVFHGHMSRRASELMANPTLMSDWCGSVLYRS
ncbi:uncharacterized protein LOC62_04G005337 [Vanrija pseudolonga]|uniref:Uncharacterized protein n=1 Tax=Vanrija pseudolonga TaxID=143232 RepID=A0AAF0YDI3_9TREE|nr:hypothetical protein LOC62_04G005337 [Vanrija pseudolonga]